MEIPTNKIVSSFKYEDNSYKMIKPSSHIMREAKFIYSKSFTQSLKDGLYTKRKLESLLKGGEIDVISDYNSRRAELLRLYTETKEVAESVTNPDEIEGLVSLMEVYRDRLVQEDFSMNAIYENTADQIAEGDRVNYLTANLIVNDSGERVWDSLESYLQDSRYEFVELCKYHIICWSYSMNPEGMVENENEKSLRSKAKELRLKSPEEKTKIVKEVRKGKKNKVSKRTKKSKTAKDETLVSSTS